MLLRILLFLIFVNSVIGEEDQGHLCQLRCMGICVKGGRGSELKTCEDKCEEYNNPHLCSEDDDRCWDSCRDLPFIRTSKASRDQLGLVENITFEYDPRYNLNIFWNPVPNADFYEVTYEPADSSSAKKTMSVAEPFVRSIQLSEKDLCHEWSVSVRAVSGDLGAGSASTPMLVPSPRPRTSPNLKLVSMVFDKTPYQTPNYEANGTITITFGYSSDWLLGDEDLDVVPMFHMLACAQPDLSQAVPVPDFYRGSQPFTIQAKIGADMMYRRCKFIYSVQEVRSERCDVSDYVHAQTDDFGSVEINCDSVQNSDCPRVNIHPGPICGQIDHFNFNVINKDKIDWGRRDSNISVNISFVPYSRPTNDKKPIYYVALYGDAQPYDSTQEETLLGVNMTKIRGMASNCLQLMSDNSCRETIPNSIVLTNLTMDKLYGVMLCGVVDPQNLTFPSINVDNRAIKTKANKLMIASKDYKKSSPGLIIGIIIAVILLILAIIAPFAYRCYKNNRKRASKLADLERRWANGEIRYTDFPSKKDLWELERRNLIIHDDKKLGSGAFGAVYLGKLIGKAEGSKDAQSTLGVNLMRAENCLVAVKMLPEYADEMSKSEFLQEIGLMKKLGYHERLVNMLACITDSEPYCLVVEYCSEGDLLHFLRERCKYMLKLDEQNIDYSSPDCEYDFDTEMIMTVKQLLMFSVQISYGLEYLAQKGFVHRDVAARNVLVNDKNSAKIGDFGLCRYIYAETSNYKSKGGRLPVKWMSPEAIRHYEFTTKSDVWSFGILMFEIITLGGTPYPGIQPDDMLKFLESGNRIPQPDNCPDDFYTVMKACWATDPAERPDFSSIRQLLALQLEEITDEYSYLKLDGGKDYYNVSYKEQEKPENEMTIPPDSIMGEEMSDIIESEKSDFIEEKSDAVGKESKKPLAPFRPPIPPRASELNNSTWQKQDLEQNDSGVSIELDSDQGFLPSKGKTNCAFSDDSSEV